MTIDDAKVLLALASTLLIPLAVQWITNVTWPAWMKFAVAALLSAAVGYLTAYTTGQILLDGSIIQNGSVIFTASQLVYYGAFRGLGLEKVLFPQTALAHQAQEQASASVANVSSETARDILDPDKTPSLDVQTNVVGK